MQSSRRPTLSPQAHSLGLAALLLLGLAGAPAAQAQGYTLNTLTSFNGTNGSRPTAGLTLLGSSLYGTTSQGGVNNDGTVFSVSTSGGVTTDLTSFNGTNGSSPSTSLTALGNTLYGTTSYGGANADGEIFSVPVTGGAPTVLTSFSGANGANPEAGLTLLGGTLYGTTQYGGASNSGTVFSVPASGGTPTNLFSFNSTNGAYPATSLTLVGNTFYGTTVGGGSSNLGTVFSIPVTGGTPTVLASFNRANGQVPIGGLTLSADGSTLYGATTQGGTMGGGEVFSIPVGGGPLTVLTSFDSGNRINGYEPNGDLILIGSTLYGTTSQGGSRGYGEAFSVSVGGGAPTVLASFDGAYGQYVDAGLTLGADGRTLYGTTFVGGAFGDGTVFSLTPNAPVPEASSFVSFGLLLLGGFGGAMLRARRRGAAVASQG